MCEQTYENGSSKDKNWDADDADTADNADRLRFHPRAFGVRVVCVVRVPFSGQTV